MPNRERLNSRLRSQATGSHLMCNVEFYLSRKVSAKSLFKETKMTMTHDQIRDLGQRGLREKI